MPDFRFLDCAHFTLPARKHLHTRNLVARLNLPNPAYAAGDKLELHTRAMRG